MGIDLGDIIDRDPTNLDAWRGRRVAFDAWNIMYQFLSNIRQPDGTPLMDTSGRVTSHLAGTLYRTSNLVESGVLPVFVFDGKPNDLKRQTLQQRRARREDAEAAAELARQEGDEETAFRKAQQSSKFTQDMAEEAMQLLRLLGIPVVQAPSEGEAQASAMAAAGEVDAAASQDFDCLLFGAPTLLRNLTLSGRRKLPGKQVWVPVLPEAIDLHANLQKLDLDRESLIEMALLVGTDFHPGIKGIGAKKALSLVQEFDTVDRLLDLIDQNGPQNAAQRAVGEQRTSLAERQAVRDIFLNPPAVVGSDIEFQNPDADGIVAFMVKERGFSEERVRSSIERFRAARGKQNQQKLFDF